MSDKTTTRATDAAVGALVGDAAALGSHWIYSKPVAEVFGNEPEFAEPDGAKYVGADGKGLGYFAHGRKRAGDLTHAGHGALVMLRALAASPGRVDLEKHAQIFQEEFGPGGNYVGYVDHPSKSLLAALARPVADGEARGVTGDPEEVQMNGLVATLPVAAAFAARPDAEFEAAVEAAVRAIQNNDLSVEYILTVHRILRRAVVDGASPRDATLAEYAAREQGRQPEVDARFRAAVERAEASEDTVAATQAFGLACKLEYGFPAIVHALLTAKTGTEAVRKAILGGGDSSSRAAVVAAVFAAAYGFGTDLGLPASWADRTAAAAEARRLAAAALA